MAALLVAGCGGRSPEREISDAMVSFSRAVLDGDGTRACRLLTPRAARELVARAAFVVGDPPPTSCPEAVKVLSRYVENRAAVQELLEKPDFRIEVRGDRAQLRTALQGERIELRRVRGDWKLDTI